MTVATQLPAYRCHKEVRAGKIDGIGQADSDTPGGTWILAIDDGNGGTIAWEVTHAWVQKHTPQVGGYLVTYADGYESYSPPEAFEDGYTRIEP